MKRLIAFTDVSCRIGSTGFSMLLTLALLGLVLAAVITRYLLESPMKGGDEIGGYLLAAITFIGLAHTWKIGGHVRIDTIITRLPAKVRNWLRLVTLTMATVFVPVVIWSTYSLVAYSSSHHVRSFTPLRVPLEWPQMTFLLGSVIFFLVVFADLVKAIRTLRT